MRDPKEQESEILPDSDQLLDEAWEAETRRLKAVPTRAAVRRRTAYPWLALSLFVVLIDQASKIWVVDHLEYREVVQLLPVLNLTLVHNPGAAFSFLADAGGWQRWFFVGISALVSLVLALWLMRMPRRQHHWLAAALALVLGGAVGNLWDRIEYGYVIDFIDVYYQHWHWPVFNIADSAITVGAVMLLIDALFLNRDPKP